MKERTGRLDAGTAGLLLALGAAAWWLLWPGRWPGVGLALGAAAIVGLARSGAARPLRPWPDGTVLLFGLTAAAGVWTAYDVQAAAATGWILLGGILLYLALSRQPRARLPALAGLWGGVGLLYAAYFLLTHDWLRWPADLTWLTALGRAWMGIRPAPGWAPLHPNVAGGIVAGLLPMALVAVAQTRRRPARLAAVLGVGVMGAAVLMSSSRGAWLALALAGGAVWTWRARRRGRRAAATRAAALGGLGVAGLLALAVGGPGLAGRLLGSVQGINRLALAGQSLDLIGDFPFTGAGLATYGGLYARYIRVAPHFFFGYGHNLFLDVWLQQGPLGLLAWLGLLAYAGWVLWSGAPSGDDPLTAVPAAALAGLVILVVHGLLDDPFYGTPGTPWLLLYPALAAAWAPAEGLAVGGRRWRRRLGLLAATVLLAAILLAALPGWRVRLAAAWRANLGALAMARVELAGWPSGEWPDGSLVPALQPAASQLAQALALDPANRTALHRLGLVALQAREFRAAVAYLAAAHAVDPGHRGIRKALGYSTVWAGTPETAAALLAPIPEAAGELAVYVGWWERQGRPDLSAHARAALALLGGQ